LRVAFGEFLLDTECRELRRSGQAVRLSPKAFDLLAFLVEKRPRALAKSECHDRVWPTTHVSEATLAGLVKELRAALGDAARASLYVKTLHGFGYAFCGTAAEAPSQGPPGLTGNLYRLFWGQRVFDLHEGDHVLGRSRDSTVWIDSESASRWHAVIRVRGETAVLEDLGSRNGTRLNDRKIESPVTLQDGDVIRIGTALMDFRSFRTDVSTKTGGDTDP
jgi:DNA-binding winged helix-turn-helix (wHTH) protein